MADEIRKAIDKKIVKTVKKQLAKQTKSKATAKGKQGPTTGTGVPGASKDVIGVANQTPIKRKRGGA